MPGTTLRTLAVRTLVACVWFALLHSVTATAQQGNAIDAGQSKNAPPALAGADSSPAQQAVVQAQEELAKLRADIARNAQQRGDEIAQRQQEIFTLAEEEGRLQKELGSLAEAQGPVEIELFEAKEEYDRIKNQMRSARGEVRTQARELRDRIEGSLVAREFPELVEQLNTLVQNEDIDLDADTAQLLSIFRRYLEIGGSVSTFEQPLQLSGPEGKVENATILRLGFLGGYYTHPEQSGFLQNQSPADELLVGRNTGLTDLQQTAISHTIAHLDEPTVLPVDVTGGLGLASLQAKDSLQVWFEKGGTFMWALVVVAIIAALLIIERCIVLAWKTMSVRGRMKKILRLVEAERFEDAERAADKMGGAAGTVLHAALVHREGGQMVMEEAVQEALLHQAPKFNARLGFIALCAAVSPLLGLLGTVTGMITTFKMVTLFGTSDPRFMAGGISEALITTQGGLYLAIPCLMFRGVLGAIADSAVQKLEAGAMSVVLVLVEHFQPASALVAPVAAVAQVPATAGVGAGDDTDFAAGADFVPVGETPFVGEDDDFTTDDFTGENPHDESTPPAPSGEKRLLHLSNLESVDSSEAEKGV